MWRTKVGETATHKVSNQSNLFEGGSQEASLQAWNDAQEIKENAMLSCLSAERMNEA